MLQTMDNNVKEHTKTIQKLLARIDAYNKSPALNADESHQLVTDTFRSIIDAAGCMQSTEFGQFIHSQGTLLLTKIEKGKIPPNSLVRYIFEIYKIAAELKEICDKFDGDSD